MTQAATAVKVFQSVLYKTNSIVIGAEDLVLVVDPCWLPGEVDGLRGYVGEIRGSKPLYLLFTHSDYDHIIGYKAFPDASVIASKAFTDKSDVEKEGILEQIRVFDDDYYIDRDYEIGYPEVQHVIDGDGTVMEIGATRLTFYHSPGHNPDGLFTVVEPLGLLIAGDYLSDTEFPYIYTSSMLYEETIAKLDVMLERHDIKLLIPGHGACTTDSTEMKKRQQSDFAYIYQMRELVAARNQQAIDDLIKGCPYPRNMMKFHRNNQKLIERELGLQQID